MHGDQDGTIPYDDSSVTLFGLNVQVYGSYTINETMESLGNYGFHSFYGSLLSPRELAELAYHLGYRTVGISDIGGFWGAVEFSQACQRMEIQPVFGCRLQVEQLGLVRIAPVPKSW